MSTGLPKVDVQVNQNRLNSSLQTDDGIAGMVLTGVTVAGKIQVNTPTLLVSLEDAETKGITQEGSNAYPYTQVKAFYDQAGAGAKLWVMLVATTVSMEDMADKTKSYAKTMIDTASPSIKLLGISRKSAPGITIANGVDQDVDKALAKADELAKSYQDTYKEFSVIVDAKDWNGNHSDLKDYNDTTEWEYATALLSSTDGSKNACVGLFLGSLAKDPVQRNPARVKSGNLPITSASFTDGKTIEEHAFFDAIHNKDYAFIRSFVGKSGYFFTDAPTCAKSTSDLNSIPHVRVITKVRSLAYQVFVDKIQDEIPVEDDGQISPALIKAWQAEIEGVIDAQMTVNGEISGVKAFIDTNQDIIGSSSINKASIDILPVGYSKYITIPIGFTKSLT